MAHLPKSRAALAPALEENRIRIRQRRVFRTRKHPSVMTSERRPTGISAVARESARCRGGHDLE